MEDIEIDPLNTRDVLALLMALERNVADVTTRGSNGSAAAFYRAHMARALKKMSEARELIREAIYWSTDGSKRRDSAPDERQMELPFGEEWK